MTNENLASVAELRIHPVKGLRGGVHMTADIEPWVWWRPALDGGGCRRPLPDQRERHTMALIEAHNTATGITLTTPGMERIIILSLPRMPKRSMWWFGATLSAPWRRV